MRGLTPLRECYRCYEKNTGPEGPNSIWISPKDISSLLRELRGQWGLTPLHTIHVKKIEDECYGTRVSQKYSSRRIY